MRIFAEGIYTTISPFIHPDYISSSPGPFGLDRMYFSELCYAVYAGIIAATILFVWLWRKKRHKSLGSEDIGPPPPP